MSEQSGADEAKPREGDARNVEKTRDNQEHELEAEQESAAAMDADVPQPAEDEPE